jgi:hypothetical protein
VIESDERSENLALSTRPEVPLRRYTIVALRRRSCLLELPSSSTRVGVNRQHCLVDKPGLQPGYCREQAPSAPRRPLLRLQPRHFCFADLLCAPWPSRIGCRARGIMSVRLRRQSDCIGGIHQKGKSRQLAAVAPLVDRTSGRRGGVFGPIAPRCVRPNL